MTPPQAFPARMLSQNRILKLVSGHYQIPARILAWVGILAIVVLSVVPATERPVTTVGPQLEHFAAFALTAGMFAIAYDLSFGRLALCALVFCGGIELLQMPLPTRHARVSDFLIDFVTSCFAFGVVMIGKKIFAKTI
jgi:VanZ family protein